MHRLLLQQLTQCGIEAEAGPTKRSGWRALLALIDAEYARLTSAPAAGKAGLLAAAGHDVRTQMNGLLGLAQLLQQSQLAPEQAECLAGLGPSSEKLLAAMNTLLDYVLIDAGGLQLQAASFDPREIADAALAAHSAAARARRQELSVVVADVPPRVVADGARCRQLLEALVGAAVAACGPGGVSLTLRTAPRGDGRLSLQAEARGPRAATPAAPAGGTDLLWLVCEELAGAMGGAIGRPAPGADPCFTLIVTCERDAVAAEAESAPDDELQGLIALFVDGDSARLRALERQAAPWGLRVVTAGDANLALGALRDAMHRGQPVDLAIIDLELPRGEGLDLARRVRSDPLLAPTPLVLLQPAAATDAPAAEGAGLFDARLPRSAGPELHACLAELSTTPHEVLRQRRQTHEVARPAAPASTRKVQGRVLVVEDVPGNALVARRMLERAGLTVTIRPNGAEALQVLSQEQFEIVLMDCEMPVLDGYQATREIRRLEQDSGRHQVVIALSGHDTSGDRQKGLQAGMDDYLTKPLKAEDVVRMLDEWLPWALGNQVPAAT